MRTTLEIDDLVLEQVRAYASARNINQGEAATLLLKRGLRAQVPTLWEHGIRVFDPGPDGSVTAEKVQDLIEALEGQSL